MSLKSLFHVYFFSELKNNSSFSECNMNTSICDCCIRSRVEPASNCHSLFLSRNFLSRRRVKLLTPSFRGRACCYLYIQSCCWLVWPISAPRDGLPSMRTIRGNWKKKLFLKVKKKLNGATRKKTRAKERERERERRICFVSADWIVIGIGGFGCLGVS